MQTTDSLSPVLPPAALWRRLAAMIYDSLLVFAIWIIVGFIVLSLFGIEQATTVDGEAVQLDPLYSYTLFGAMVVSSFLFFSLFWMKSGQTLGMQAWKIRIQNNDGSSISLKQALVRFILAPISLLLLGAGYFFMYCNIKRETFHDRLSHSQVITLSSRSGPQKAPGRT